MHKKCLAKYVEDLEKKRNKRKTLLDVFLGKAFVLWRSSPAEKWQEHGLI